MVVLNKTTPRFYEILLTIVLLFKFFKLNEELSRGLIPSVLLSGIDLIWQQCSVSLHRVGMTVMLRNNCS